MRTIALELFHIPGSSSFAAHCALAQAGAQYQLTPVDPKDRSQPPSLREVNPLGRVPALRDGEICLAETAAILMHLADRFPAAGLGPSIGDPARADWYRWLAWLAGTFHPAWEGYFAPARLTDDDSGHDGIRRAARRELDGILAHVEGRLAETAWCAGGRLSAADLYLYMLMGWASHAPELAPLGPACADHLARVGALPAVIAVRELEGLDERLQRRV